VALQTTLGFLSLAVAGPGPVHGINAFVLVSAAVHAARRTGRSPASGTLGAGR
jgi:hypothetical protein